MTKSNKQFRKFLYGIVLAGVLLLLCFGMIGRSAAHARQSAMEPVLVYLPMVLRNFTGTPPTNQTLTVNMIGIGSGTVTSSPEGINCGITCTYDFAYNTLVTLTATPTAPFTFVGWSGAGCSGTGTCNVTMSSAQTVSATFNPPAGVIFNGDFESGQTGWTQFSSHGWDVLYDCSDPSLCNDITPHSGTHLAWLGGDFNESSYIQQPITISSSAPYLVYWQWIGSDEYCGSYYDYSQVLINGNLVDKYDLCAGTSTTGWVPHSINLSAYAGQSVTLQIGVVMNSTYLSNLFLDDVSFQASAPAAASIPVAAARTGSPIMRGKFDMAQGKK